MAVHRTLFPHFAGIRLPITAFSWHFLFLESAPEQTQTGSPSDFEQQVGWGTRIAPELLLVFSLILLSPVTPLCVHTSYLSKFYENLTPDRDILLIVLPLLLLVYSLFLLRPAPPLFAPNLVFVFARSAVCSQSFRPLPPSSARQARTAASAFSRGVCRQHPRAGCCQVGIVISLHVGWTRWSKCRVFVLYLYFRRYLSCICLAPAKSRSRMLWVSSAKTGCRSSSYAPAGGSRTHRILEPDKKPRLIQNYLIEPDKKIRLIQNYLRAW